MLVLDIHFYFLADCIRVYIDMYVNTVDIMLVTEILIDHQRSTLRI